MFRTTRPLQTVPVIFTKTVVQRFLQRKQALQMRTIRIRENWYNLFSLLRGWNLGWERCL